MKYGLLEYEENPYTFNLGDYIQSLAAHQFLPQVDYFVNREKMGEYRGEKIKMILNGWFTHNTHNWIPSDDIEPLFISFHINNTAAPFMLREKGIAYLKKHQPIGCRDQFTVDILKEKGIAAYFSGCLTLTLDSYKVDDNQREDKIYIVDPLYGYTTRKKIFQNNKTLTKSILNGTILDINKRKQHLRKIINHDLWMTATHVQHEQLANTYSRQEKFDIAEKLINMYARAKLVITSRIHCALPCLALGTPVIFMNGFENFVDSCRFDGIIDYFNRIDINTKTGEWTTNFGLTKKLTTDISVQNSDKYLVLSDKMKEIARKFIEKNTFI